MIIKKMTATFGRLDQAQLELKDGLNLIQAPNEGGKSTWCGFLRSMLYGIPTRDRDKKGYLADKNRYQPWSGAPMEGEMELTWQGRDITLRRFAKGSAPFAGFSAVYTGTEEGVPGLTGENCGQTLLGVGREVYERSAFVGQSPTLAIDGTPELERRIAALVSSGEEDVSFSQTEACLREWQRRRQHNHTGMIPRLEGELAQVEGTLERMQAVNTRVSAAQARRLELEREKKELEWDLHVHKRLEQRELNRRYAQAKEEWSRAQAELDALRAEQAKYGPLPDREELRRAQGELQYLKVLDEEIRQAQQEAERAGRCWHDAREQACDPRFPDMTGEEALMRAREDRTAVEALLLQAERSGSKRPLLFLPGLLLGGGLVLAGWLLRGTVFPYLWGGLGLFGALGILLLFWSNHEISQKNARARQLLARYGAQTPEEITGCAEDYRRREGEARQAGEEAEWVRVALADRQARQANTRDDLLNFVHSFAPEVKDLFGCSAALSRALGLEDKLRECAGRTELTRLRCEDLQAQGGREFDTLEMLYPPERSREEVEQRLKAVEVELAATADALATARGELNSLGSPAALDARREALILQLARRRQEYEALSQALDSLHRANARLQERFAPELNRRAGEILAALTGGRYCTLSLDREFSAAAVGPDSLLPRSALALSRGTADQIYLAVRLAVCQLCLPQDDPAPLVLDDALISFDDRRMALALDYLAGMGRQVLLFSCQEREGRYLSGREDVNIAALG